MTPEPLTQLRWIIRAEPPGHRRCEELISQFCVGAISSARAAADIETAYVSKHAPDDVWFTIYAPPSQSEAVTTAVRRQLAGLTYSEEACSDPAKEQLLTERCKRFRTALDLTSRIAIDIHESADRAEAQRELVRIGVRGRKERVDLEAFLTERSRTYRELNNQADFWNNIDLNCLTGQTTDAIHWLYNIVLGFDWQWPAGEAAILNYLGL